MIVGILNFWVAFSGIVFHDTHTPFGLVTFEFAPAYGVTDIIISSFPPARPGTHLRTDDGVTEWDAVGIRE